MNKQFMSSFDLLNNHGGYRTGTLVLVTGSGGSGKTTFLEKEFENFKENEFQCSRIFKDLNKEIFLLDNFDLGYNDFLINDFKKICLLKNKLIILTHHIPLSLSLPSNRIMLQCDIVIRLNKTDDDLDIKMNIIKHRYPNKNFPLSDKFTIDSNSKTKIEESLFSRHKKLPKFF